MYRLAVTGVSLMLSGCAIPYLHTNFITVADEKRQIASYQTLNPDCTARPPPSVTVLSDVSNGKITITEGHNYSAFPRRTHRYECNLWPLDARQIWYEPNRGFRGFDSVLVEVISTDGSAARVTIDIWVQ